MSSFLTFMSSWKHRQHFTGNVIDKQLSDGGGGGDQKVGATALWGLQHGHMIAWTAVFDVDGGCEWLLSHFISTT